jgi:hypothetical protein
MADLIITCTTCGNTIPVSEFVDPDRLFCMKCKTKIQVPERITEPSTVAQRLKLTVEKPPEPPPPPMPPQGGKKIKKSLFKSSEQNDVRQYLPKAKKRIQKRRATLFEAKVLPWLLFIVLSLILSWLRYWPGALQTDILSALISGGVWVLLFIHITVVCYAFGDDAFYGILCLIIPGYSLYYLFIQADQMILRSTMAALIIAFGWDAILAAQQLWAEVYATVSLWIATTDSVKK